MSWSPNDLVSDADLVAYERTILTQFAAIDWRDRRAKALEDWLFPLLANTGLAPERLRTRYVPDGLLSITGGVATDQAASSALDLAAILEDDGDALYVGSSVPFRGLSVRMEDAVSSTVSALTVSLWADTWLSVAVTDGTASPEGTPFARGGAITWRVPDDLVRRDIAGQGPYYWARLQLSAPPTGAVVTSVSAIRRSRLAAPLTLRTLALIFREAPSASDGPWLEKAEWYETEAERAWQRAIPLIGGEFDTDNDDVIDAVEAGQTTDTVSGGGVRWERY